MVCVLVPLVPLAGLFAEHHSCACGMSKDACFCELVAARPGARCEMKGAGRCSMQPVQTPSEAILFASFDLRGWLQLRSLNEAGPVLTLAGTVPPADVHAPRPISRSPESPPPRAVRFA